MPAPRKPPSSAERLRRRLDPISAAITGLPSDRTRWRPSIADPPRRALTRRCFVVSERSLAWTRLEIPRRGDDPSVVVRKQTATAPSHEPDCRDRLPKPTRERSFRNPPRLRPIGGRTVAAANKASNSSACQTWAGIGSTRHVRRNSRKPKPPQSRPWPKLRVLNLAVVWRNCQQCARK